MTPQFIEVVAVLACTLFTGTAVYITAVEHPARLSCGVEAAVAEWVPSYKCATVMQVPLALIAGLFGIVRGTQGGGPLWLWAAMLILAVIPFTLFAIRPTNNRLLDPRRGRRSDETLRLLNALGRASMPSEGRSVPPRRCSSSGRPHAETANRRKDHRHVLHAPNERDERDQAGCPASWCRSPDSTGATTTCSTALIATSMASTNVIATHGTVLTANTTIATNGASSQRHGRGRRTARHIPAAVPQTNSIAPTPSAPRRSGASTSSGCASAASVAAAMAITPHNMGKCRTLNTSLARHERAFPLRVASACSNASRA